MLNQARGSHSRPRDAWVKQAHPLLVSRLGQRNPAWFPCRVSSLCDLGNGIEIVYFPDLCSSFASRNDMALPLSQGYTSMTSKIVGASLNKCIAAIFIVQKQRNRKETNHRKPSEGRTISACFESKPSRQHTLRSCLVECSITIREFRELRCPRMQNQALQSRKTRVSTREG